MSIVDAPDWLRESFVTSLRQVGAATSGSHLTGEADALLRRWSHPSRVFHNVRHLVSILGYLDELAPSTHDPEVLTVATWYHGASSPQTAAERSDAEASGDGWEDTGQRLRALGVSEDVVGRIVELISYVARSQAPRDDVDAQVLVDADLANLSAIPQEYKRYRTLLREEHSDTDDLTYLKARRAAVRRLLDRPSIYSSPLAQSWESAARDNLEAEAAKLDESLATLRCTEGAAALDEPEAPEDAGSSPAPSATSVVVLKRRHLHKNPVPADDGAEEDDTASMARLPLTMPDAEQSMAEASSLETAAEILKAAERAERPAPRRASH